MPNKRFPQEDQEWKIHYGPDGLGDIRGTFQVSFTMNPGKITTSRRLQPHTTVLRGITGNAVPTQYVYSNADGTPKYWKYWGDLWWTQDPQVAFVQDTLTDSPSDSDGDLVVFGRTDDELYDILYASNGTNIARFNRDTSTTAWTPDYWTGLQKTILSVDPSNDFPVTSISNATPAVVTQAGHGLAIGQAIVFSTSGTLPAPINVPDERPYYVSATGFTANTFQFSTSPGGASVATTTAGAGTHSVNTGNIRITTSTAHTYGVFDRVVISGSDALGANGTHRIGVITANTFDLIDSVFKGFDSGTPGEVARIFRNSDDFTFLGQPPLNSSFPVILKRFSSNSQDLLFIGNGNVVHSIDLIDQVVLRRLVFFADYECNWIQVTNDKVYVGFKNKIDAKRPSYVVEYDPFNETANPVIVNSGQTIGFIYENICHIVDVKGYISRFNSNGFSPVEAFPFAFIDGVRLTAPHRNGVTTIDNRPHFLMPGVRQFMVQVMPAGVWCWEPDTNRLYHKGSPAQSSSVQDDYGASTIGGIFSGNNYGALYGLPPTGSKTQDYFAGVATKVTTNNNDGIHGTFSTVVVGSPAGHISMDNRGWIVTTKMYSKDINSIFRNVVTHYDNNQYPQGRQSGEILIKYRTSDPTDSSASVDTGTWTSTNTFTVSLAAVPNMVVGDEVFIASGKGAGLSAHITTIAGTTVTIDEVMTGATGEFIFVYENWRKLFDETHLNGQLTDNTVDHWQYDIPENEESFVQFKVEIRSGGVTPFRGFALEELGLGYQENLRQEGGQRDRNN